MNKSHSVDYKVNTGNNKNTLNATAIGSAILSNSVGDKIKLNEVLYVPQLSRPLISATRMFEDTLLIKKKKENEAEIIIDNKKCFKVNTLIIC